MLKNLLLGGAMLIAVPALAQTAGQTATHGKHQGTATTTNDHDPTVEDQDAARGNAQATVSTQVNGGVNTPAAGVPAGTAAPPDMTGINTRGTIGQGGIVNGTATSHQGTALPTGSAHGGTGGPLVAARNYPPCSRTVTDSCIQLHERGVSGQGN